MTNTNYKLKLQNVYVTSKTFKNKNQYQQNAKTLIKKCNQKLSNLYDRNKNTQHQNHKIYHFLTELYIIALLNQ